jgi:methionyl-tRNA synthetase
MVGIDEFRKVELRVGRITLVEDIPGARLPLYKLVVDLGQFGKRTIASKTKDAYEKEELLGKLVICVANLESKTIAGIESDGMILAAEQGEVVSVLTVDREMAVGSMIH